MKHKNFFLINGSGENVKCYIINAHEDELHFWRYEKGIKYPVCSISDIGNRLLYFAVDENQEFQMSIIEYPSVIIRKPDGKRLPIHQKHQLELTTENRNIFIVHNKSYPDLPVSNATIYFKREKDKELRLLASVYIDDKTGELKIDFI